jgi:hypothetical protein
MNMLKFIRHQQCSSNFLLLPRHKLEFVTMTLVQKAAPHLNLRISQIKELETKRISENKIHHCTGKSGDYLHEFLPWSGHSNATASLIPEKVSSANAARRTDSPSLYRIRKNLKCGVLAVDRLSWEKFSCFCVVPSDHITLQYFSCNHTTITYSTIYKAYSWYSVIK